MEISLDLHEILKKSIDIIDFKSIKQCILRVIDLDELIINLKSYKNLLESIDIICIVTNSMVSNIESTLELLPKLKQILPNVDYYIIANFQDKEALPVEKIEKLLGAKTFGFSAVQKDANKKINLIIKDILRRSIQDIEEKKYLSLMDDELWSEIEIARDLDIQGKTSPAVKKFSNIASQIKKLYSELDIKNQEDKLNILYHLCKAWESSALAEESEDPDKFLEAANYFTKASESAKNNKIKLLALGNSWFCKALNLQLEFDKSNQTKDEKEHYLKIKEMIQKASNFYEEAGFKKEAKSALASFSYSEI
ncbi:MAG: hypothetical protein JSV62_10050 [Promethearchaeota archaeon]|nr:MAG: hypothetical protein JSV62_10050 [Candidatus Lokiarchaeota archaeon]